VFPASYGRSEAKQQRHAVTPVTPAASQGVTATERRKALQHWDLAHVSHLSHLSHLKILR